MGSSRSDTPRAGQCGPHDGERCNGRRSLLVRLVVPVAFLVVFGSYWIGYAFSQMNENPAKLLACEAFLR
jgi:hypothetical protein